jgi:hypothetical protein
VRGKALRERAIDRVGPAIFMANDFVSDMGHRFTCPRAAFQVGL